MIRRLQNYILDCFFLLRQEQANQLPFFFFFRYIQHTPFCLILCTVIHLMQVVEQTIRPCLVELSEDPDVDVRYFATQALHASEQVMMSS